MSKYIKKGKNGGRRPGSGRRKGNNTILAQEAKAYLIQEYLKNIGPIVSALIRKAKKGDIHAIKELNDRVYGKAIQPVEGDFKAKLTIKFDNSFNDTPRNPKNNS